jgi:putative hydrolase of the HAD superfamily
VIDAVLWDIGQVVYPSPFERFDELEASVGLPAGTLPRGPFAQDPAYVDVDQGRLGEPEYWGALQARGRALVPSFDVHTDLRRLGWRGRGRPAVLGLLRDIRPTYHQGVLTNDATAFLGPRWRDDWELADLFEVIVDSVDVGARKPERRAYDAGVAALGVPPERVLFVDDLTVNVDAARGAGLQAARFDTTDVEGSVRSLRSRLAL